MRLVKPAPTAAEIERRRVAQFEVLGIDSASGDSDRVLPVFGEGPPPAPDGVFSAFELEQRHRTFAVMLGIDEGSG
jgi:hypothetical protein